MNSKQIISEIKKLGNQQTRKDMARFGINIKNAEGVWTTQLRKIIKNTERNNPTAQKLWKTNIHEAKIISCLLFEPKKISEKQMDSLIKKFDSWDLVDLFCIHLFSKTSFAHNKAIEWTNRKKEFEKRTGFALMATLAVHDKQASDKKFEKFFPIIKRESIDERNFVKKAVNWALRQIGKRNLNLNKKAIKVAEQIQKKDSTAAKWIANNALNELRSDAVQKRLIKKSKKIINIH